MKCPKCEKKMEGGFVYVRGFGSALFWSQRKDARFWSRKGLEQIDLRAVSLTGIGAQAVIEAWRCADCKMLSFHSDGLPGN